MSSRKFFSLPRLTIFYLPLVVLASIAVGMVIVMSVAIALYVWLQRRAERWRR